MRGSMEIEIIKFIAFAFPEPRIAGIRNYIGM